MKKIIVTGSNKGIGLGIVKYLATFDPPKWDIIMACRNIDLAQKAMEQVISVHKHAKISIQKLDIASSDSISEFINRIQETHQKVDILLNNAGVKNDDNFNVETVDWAYSINFYGTIQLSERMLPLISDKGKIITMGSTAGKVAYKGLSQNLKERFRNKNITKEELIELLTEFRQSVADGTHKEKGWPEFIYRVSKLGIDIYASIQAKQKQVLEREIQVYVCCPGYVATDMTKYKGHLTIEEGTKTPLYLVQLPFELNQKLQGQYFECSAVNSLFEQVQ